MSYFYDKLKDADPYLKVNNIALPEVQTPEAIKINMVTDGGRLADNLTYEGKVIGIKREVTLVWDYMNKAHFDILYRAIVTHYNNTSNMFMNLVFNSFSPDGIVSMVVYGGSNLVVYNVADTTDRLADKLGDEYRFGGSKYDILYKDVSVHFVER